MASAFGHALAAVALGKGFSKRFFSWKFWLLGIACAILPDADVISFKLGIAYEHVLGHRGFSHSIVFALGWSLLVVLLFYHKTSWKTSEAWLLFLYFFLATISHAVLDAMTTGGLGVAFFAPFDNTRYFFPWRPIQVSPIGLKNFFGEWGLRVLASEALWIGLPALCWLGLVRLFKINR